MRGMIAVAISLGMGVGSSWQVQVRKHIGPVSSHHYVEVRTQDGLHPPVLPSTCVVQVWPWTGKSEMLSSELLITRETGQARTRKD